MIRGRRLCQTELLTIANYIYIYINIYNIKAAFIQSAVLLSCGAVLRCLAAPLPLDLLHRALFVSGSGTVANGLKALLHRALLRQLADLFQNAHSGSSGAVNWLMDPLCRAPPNCHPSVHSGPTEKVQALHRSLNMADAAIGKRFLWSIVRFFGAKFTLEADILQVRDVYYG